MNKKNTWENTDEEKWIFDQKEGQKFTDNSVQYIKYFTAFFVFFSVGAYFIANKFL